MTAAKSSDSRLVYSSEAGRICPECARPVASCSCRRSAPASPAGDGIVRVGRQTKGRKGKGVTLITGLPLDAAALKELAQQLKKKCGSGGTIKDGTIEIQGDHRDLLLVELQRLGWTVKRSGG